jgi:tRNA dimethylallyltransferase
VSSRPLRFFCLTGPTACGKSDLAVALARTVPLEIISMDSAMVYRGMDIGTAKPSADLRAAVPHHLIDVADPAESYSAGRFRREATAIAAEVLARGRVPLLVGGTLLYLRALRGGLASLPQADAPLRLELDRLAEREGWPAMHRRLAAVDPEAARRIAPGDRQRIQRALEVYELTGRPLTAHLASPHPAPLPEVPAVALVPGDRAWLAERIERRFDAMVEEGLVAEVERLRARGDLHPGLPALRAVGYRQIWAYLHGEHGWEEARRRAIVATRRLAKRQMTWLRSEPDIAALPAFGPETPEQVADRLRAAFAGWL